MGMDAPMVGSEELVAALRRRQPLLWLNPAATHARELGLGAQELLAQARAGSGLSADSIEQAQQRWARWEPALARRFPELSATAGRIESPLVELPDASRVTGAFLPGRCFIKRDDALPVAGSIKARGGIYEVLVVAEEILQEKARRAGGVQRPGPIELGEAERTLLAQHTISVGSTGNLGMSIGIAAAALGFRAVVHMSREAKAWKKARLRAQGVEVVEHAGDYSSAVAAGRAQARLAPRTHFVDDENSRALFLGYAVAAPRLRGQLEQAGVAVDAQHPLIVYLPCGVGGAPGGITFGLKQVYGDAVHALLAEPCASPALLLRLALRRAVTVYEIGLDNRTQADGLAVAQASEWVATTIAELVDGAYTVDDDDLFRVLARLHRATGVALEPSACAAFLGAPLLARGVGARWLQQISGKARPQDCTHVFWATGGALVPPEEFERFLAQGNALLPQAERNP